MTDVGSVHDTSVREPQERPAGVAGPMRSVRSVRSVLPGPAVEIAGWALLAAGVVALVLPGPGLLGVCAGLALLAPRHPWAMRRLTPLRERAVAGAALAVRSLPRIAVSALGVLAVVVVGAVWIARPAAPSWWPLADSWWLVGGWATGVTIVVSGLLSGAALVWSVVTLRDQAPRTAAAG